jgi:hypothetical protein
MASRAIIAHAFPDYVPYFDETMASSRLHLYNMFIASREVMNEYCEWLFKIFDLAIEQGLHRTKVGREKRVYGFLAERLFNVWIARNKPGFVLLECPVLETEPRSKAERVADVTGRMASHYLKALRVGR